MLCARFITSLFQCPNIPTATAPGAPTPTLAHFVAYALHRTRLPSIVTFAALLLLQRLKIRFPAARGSSGHRLFISAFMIASKVICDDTYSNQSWGIVAQKMFALKEINQMEREMCGYLEWNLNVGGDEVLDFEARIRAEHGPNAVMAPKAASSASSLDLPPVASSSSSSPAVAHGYPSPETTPDPTRPIRPVPSAYRHKPSASLSSRQQQQAFPSPPHSPEQHHHYLSAAHASPQPPQFSNSANSSLASSPASDDCKTPSPVAVTSAPGRAPSVFPKAAAGVDFDPRRHRGYPINVGGW